MISSWTRCTPAGEANKKVPGGGRERDGDGAGLEAVGGVAVAQVLLAQAVQAHHRRHRQVRRHQRHQEAPVLLSGEYDCIYLQTCKVDIYLFLMISATLTSEMSTLASLWIFASFTTTLCWLSLMSGMSPLLKSHVWILHMQIF